MNTEPMVVDVSQDWLHACDVQQRFMHHPAPAPGAFRYAAHCRQLRALGGDGYDFLPLPLHRLALAIGDASGKSLPAALIMASVLASLRTAAFFAGDRPAAVLDAVNRQLHTASPVDRFATLFYGVFDSATRTLRYANAGHYPPLVIRRNGSLLPLDGAGLPLGILPGSIYEEGFVQLDRGDLVIAFTDGVIEAPCSSGEEWGLERLTRTALENKALSAAALVDAIFAAMDEFSAGRETDDATVVVLHVD